MVGGLHTSGYFLIWITHYLSLHQEVKDKLINEMKEKVGNDRGTKLKNYVCSTDRCVGYERGGDKRDEEG